MKSFSFLSLRQRILISGFVFSILFVRFFAITNTRVITDNMNPILKKGDFVFGLRFSKLFFSVFMDKKTGLSPKRGTLIFFRFPGDEEQTLIRRVIALPGDKLSLKKDILFLNNKKADYRLLEKGQKAERLPEQKHFYTIKPDSSMDLELVVPQAHVFVLSDHRKSGDDSRNWGFVPIENIESCLGLIWFSISKDSRPDWSRFFLLVQ